MTCPKGSLTQTQVELGMEMQSFTPVDSFLSSDAINQIKQFILSVAPSSDFSKEIDQITVYSNKILHSGVLFSFKDGCAHSYIALLPDNFSNLMKLLGFGI